MGRTISRRQANIGLGAAALAFLAPAAFARESRMIRFAYVGCRTSRERNAQGNGIQVYRIAPDGSWQPHQLVGDLINPSYLAFDQSRRFLHSVHGDSTEVSSFAIEPDGKLRFLGRVPTGGRNPVHLMPDPTNRFMIVANHIASGELRSGIASLPIGSDGRLQPPVDVVTFSGAIGPHRVEQPFPKPHQVQFDRAGRFIAVPDKGCDRTAVYRLALDGRLTEVEGAAARARESAGPRHTAFHPGNRLAYVVNELDSTIQACRFDPASGRLSPFQLISALPEDFTGNSRAAEIAVSDDGRHVYASNRGSDTIGAFAVQANGRLVPLGWCSAGGRTPRFFVLGPDSQSLFVADEESHRIVALARRSGGVLADPRPVAENGSPTCILLA
jgi:6-phosphogluconolactonase (cycloisomerase 2 family)